jgi:sec-independent protein translocase protein TatA
MFGIGSMEMMLLFVVALLLFGNRLPEVARSMGKSLTEFKRALHGIDDDIRTTVDRSVSAASRPMPLDERDAAVAPKFEPPRSEPTQAAPAEAAAVAATAGEAHATA